MTRGEMKRGAAEREKERVYRKDEYSFANLQQIDSESQLAYHREKGVIRRQTA